MKDQPQLPSRAEHERDIHSAQIAQLRHEELIDVLSRVAERLDSWTDSYEDSMNSGREVHRLNVQAGK